MRRIERAAEEESVSDVVIQLVNVISERVRYSPPFMEMLKMTPFPSVRVISLNSVWIFDSSFIPRGERRMLSVVKESEEEVLIKRSGLF